jgi:hypothetical protein
MCRQHSPRRLISCTEGEVGGSPQALFAVLDLDKEVVAPYLSTLTF